ncbi:hypothetical protein phiA034_gene0064 [Aeromonas phage phiA034]|uniref:Uncharacterized protein n=1 Tax=Aeromonas phage phiA034 TaxID=2985287 RepID=A0AAF0C133_9CAUD|nr:hypothetical protein phiA034_gene0064 [Aeromonas phage phiA034]
MKARVTSNPYNLGNGWFNVGQVVEIERETAHYYVLVKSSYRINKEKMALTGWAGRYAHSIELEIIEEAPAVEADPVAMNTEILIATTTAEAETARQVADVAECLGSLGPVSKDYDPISETVARVFARLPVGVAVRDALDRLGGLPFVLTAYPVGAQDMIPNNPIPTATPCPGVLPPPWVYQCGLSGEDFLYTRGEWRQDVEDGNTQRGYWDWVEAQIEEEADAADLEVRQALAAGAVVVLVARELVDAATVAEIGAWLNNGDRDAEFAVFPDDATQVIGNLSDENRVNLEREIRRWLAERDGDGMPHAVVSVGSVWNARPVPSLSLAGAFNLVARSYSGITMELGENLPDANALVITWDRSPGEMVEREVRSAMLAALNKMADALPGCCLSLSVPNEWHGRPVDREGLAAWCGRQGGGDFALSLNALPGPKLAVHWVTGPRPVAGLEAGILADARTWLHEGGTLDAEPADEPAPVEPCRMSIAFPRTWNAHLIDFEMVRAWCAERSHGFKLEPAPTVCEPGGVVASWLSGADPVSVRPGLGRELEALAVDFLNALYPAEPATVAECSPCTARIVVPKTWNGYAVSREPLQAWALDTLGPLFPSVEFDVVTGDRQQSDGVAVKLTSRAEPSALVFPGRTAARDAITAYMVNRLEEVYPGL